ncbi:hypothetical protein GQ600_6935 [Phytophthora cactorum]|nr:hypothetical protein GQ600_6935 [Phytophthora cactorum]
MPTARDNNVTAEINIQTLQKLHEDDFVIVRNYSGGANFRQAKTQFYYVVGDSEANARSRDAELTNHDDVQWITDKEVTR